MANICPHLTHLELSDMSELTEEGRLSLVSLLRQIVQNDPRIETLNMYKFSRNKDRDQNIGELVLETLLSYSVDSIIDLNLGKNSSWFRHPPT